MNSLLFMPENGGCLLSLYLLHFFPSSRTFALLLYIWLLRTEIWRRQWQPTPVLLPGESHERRSLVGCSPWGREESDRTERLHFHFSLSCIGEGNGNPLHCSCLENPRDGGAWWAAVLAAAAEQKLHMPASAIAKLGM